MNKTHFMPAIMFYTTFYLQKKYEPALEDFIAAGYSKASYYRIKKDFNDKKFYLLKERDSE